MNEKTIFSILFQSQDKVIHAATGFLISENGLFISVGHTFRKCSSDKNQYKALFKDGKDIKVVNFQSLYYKSLEIDNQKVPEYIDIVIGKLEIDNTSYLVLDRKRPGKKQRLMAYAYLNTKEDNDYGINFENLIDLDKIILTSKSMAVLYGDTLISPSEKIDRKNAYSKYYLFNNSVTLEGKLRKGASGCPIVDEKTGFVKGVLFGSPKYLNETNILLSKWCSKQVLFKTSFKYNPYDYLNVKMR